MRNTAQHEPRFGRPGHSVSREASGRFLGGKTGIFGYRSPLQSGIILQMARKKNGKNGSSAIVLPNHTRRAIASIFFFVIGVFLTLAAFGSAGVAGSDAYRLLNYLLGFGYFVVPLLFIVLGGAALREESSNPTALKTAASALFLVSGLGFVDMVSGHGGLLGRAIAGPVLRLFDLYAGSVILGALALAALLIILEGSISLSLLIALASYAGRAARWIGRAFAGLFRRDGSEEEGPGLSGEEEDGSREESEGEYEDEEAAEDGEESEQEEVRIANAAPAYREGLSAKRSSAEALKALLGTYNAPPLSLLERDRGKASVGDIKANANIIKRTLQNFGIIVELDEISIGPSVTRYAIKPAEGVRLSKIVALQQNLELALAAHPVRIEAPIPGKSLVGIEVPNSAKVTVGLGTMLASPEFAESGKPLLVALGRDIVGGSHFGNLAKMPHLLIAGATGSGKSVSIHSLITSLLYRNGPQSMRLLLIDPKRVELTMYNRVPHLLCPVITDPKRAIMALRWAGKEMQRRYDILESNRVRDIQSYHSNILKPALEKFRSGGRDAGEGEEVPEAMPYIVVVIDELADIMQTFPRELEAAVVRLAQMSRAVGIHLVLSTQRPSVNVITGLIKANIPARMALQVASQIDSRTILDGSGAEKLLGAGDMLFLSGDMGKPIRLQSAYIGEDEVKQVADYIAKHNEAELPVDIGGASPAAGGDAGAAPSSRQGFGGDGFDDEVDDEMYQAARLAVIEAGKASTSYIQRKLRLGYARAARIMDLLEERGVIGPQDGAKPREILEGRGAGAEDAAAPDGEV